MGDIPAINKSKQTSQRPPASGAIGRSVHCGAVLVTGRRQLSAAGGPGEVEHCSTFGPDAGVPG